MKLGESHAVYLVFAPVNCLVPMLSLSWVLPVPLLHFGTRSVTDVDVHCAADGLLRAVCMCMAGSCFVLVYCCLAADWSLLTLLRKIARRRRPRLSCTMSMFGQLSAVVSGYRLRRRSAPRTWLQSSCLARLAWASWCAFGSNQRITTQLNLREVSMPQKGLLSIISNEP